MRIRLVFGTLLLAVVAGSAQELKQQTGTGVVSGRVVDAATGAPMPGAKVHLSTVNPPIGYYSSYRDVAAESDGTFTFNGVPAGTIELRARADGYLEGQFGRRRPAGDGVWFPLAEGEQFRDAEILIWREARIAGHVVDEAGKALAGVTVNAWRVGATDWQNGRVTKARSAETDSTGDYVIEELTPGSYVIALHATKTTVRARPSSAYTGWFPDSILPMVGVSLGPLPARPPGTLYVELPRAFPTPVTDATQPERSYASEFIPGGSVPDFDNPLRLASGETRAGVDFALRLVETGTVSGRLDGPHRTSHADIALRHPGFSSGFADSGSVEAATLTDPDWTFTLLQVPPGRYTLYERRFDSNGSDVTMVAVGAWSDRPIEITAQGLRDLVIERPQTALLGGSVIYHGESRPSAIQVNAVPVGFAESDRYRHGQLGRGSFTIEGVVPGRYLLQVSGSPWWLDSVALDGQDITGQTFDVGLIDLSSIVVTVDDRPSPLDGAVYGADARLSATASVVVFPVDRKRWSDVRSPIIRGTRAWKGHFKFDHLPPGEYYVTAMDDARMDDWPSPAFLDRIRASATRITMKAGQKQVVSLPLR